jgi:hypothetical protein
VNPSLLWRAGALQALSVAGLSIALALALPHSFFEDWGWLVGPAAWLLCAALTAWILGLALPSTLLGAALAGIPSVAAVLIGLHWAGAALAIVLFAFWCARLPRGNVAWTSG